MLNTKHTDPRDFYRNNNHRLRTKRTGEGVPASYDTPVHGEEDGLLGYQPPTGNIESKETPQMKDGILFHYGGSGNGAIGDFSEGCQSICGRGFINPDGRYVTGKEYTGNPDESWPTTANRKDQQGAYDAFADIWRNRFSEADLVDSDRYYNMYRELLKI